MPSSTSPSKRRWRFVRRRSLRHDTGDEVARAYRDTEDLKLTEEAIRRNQADLAEARRQLQITIDTIPALVVSYDADGRCDFVNRTWQNYTGITLQEARSEGRSDFHPDDIDRADRAWRASLATGEPFSIELRARRADGEYLWHSIRRVPLRSNAGEVTKWYGVGFDIEDRKRAESALQRSEAYLTEAQRLNHSGSFGWNVSSGEIFWSEETFRIFGYAPTANVTIEMVLNRVHPDDLALVEGVIDRAATHKDAFDFEHRLQMPDGSVKHLHVVARALVDEPQNLQFAGTVMDITARKATEQALRRSEKRYQNLFQAMAVSLWELDYTRANDMLRALHKSGVADFVTYFRENPDAIRELMRATHIIDVNDQTVELFGCGNKKEELLTTLEPFLPEESWDAYIAGVASAISGSTFFSAENRFRRLDGTLFDGHITIRYAPESKDSGLAGIIDISARKQAFLALEKSELRYRLLFHNMPLALYQISAQPLVAMFKDLRAQGVTDLSAYIDDHPHFLANMIGAQKFEEVNDYTVRLFGARDRNELIGSSPWHGLKNHDTLRRAVESRWRGEEFYQEATKLVTRNGRVIDALFTTARPQIEGLPITLVGVFDLTKQVRAEEELQRLRADFAHAARISILGELTASVAHEVNQPLAAIAAGGEASLRWLSRPTPNVDEVRELTKRVVADARRASEIIARIRAMATRHVPEQTLLSLDDVIREALLFLRHEVQSRRVAVTHVPALGSQKVLADRTQLQQVIVNLAVNAVQAIAQAGSTNRTITFRTVVQDSTTLRCSVEDSGPGVEPQHVTRLFDSFFTTKQSGMGMGLRICRSVIEAHGGRIAADNESALGGARFFFTLPIADAAT